VYEGLNDENDANINATAVETLRNQAIDNERQNHEIINATVCVCTCPPVTPELL